VYLGIFPGALAYVAWSQALAHLPTSQAASLLYIIPVIALGIAWVWLGEVPMVLAVFGGGLVIAGVLIVNTRGRVAAIPQTKP